MKTKPYNTLTLEERYALHSEAFHSEAKRFSNCFPSSAAYSPGGSRFAEGLRIANKRYEALTGAPYHV